MNIYKNMPIRLELDGERINANKFISSIRIFYDIINEVAENIAGKLKPVKWIVSVDKGSIYVDFKPEVFDNKDKVLEEKINETIDNGLMTLEETEQQPEYFNINILSNFSRLASIIQPIQEDGLDKIKIWTNGKPIEVTHHIVANVDKIIGIDYKDYGGLEGKLETLSERKKHHFVIYDFLNDKAIRCNFAEDLLDEVLHSFGKRVYVYGLIKYRKTGEPISIEVEKFKPLKNEDELPRALDVLGIYKD